MGLGTRLISLAVYLIFASSYEDSLMFIADSDVTSKHHDRPFIPEVTSKGLTTASKEGTIDELDRRHAGHDQQNAASSSLPSSASASVAQASTYRPHAIVVNVVQVSTVAFYLIIACKPCSL